jgi:hypothetical protein
MKLRLLLFPFLAPIWLLGFTMALLGENEHNGACARPTNLALTQHGKELQHTSD